MAKTCKNCEYCKRLHTITWYRYYAEKLYYCSARKEIVERSNACGQWEKLSPKYDISTQRLEQTINDISAIIQACENTQG